MHFTGEVYRHPMEASTQLLEVTIGCSHNECTFCTMYRRTQFGISKMDHIIEDLEELKSSGRKIKRFFLVNGEAFVLSYSKLKTIGELINEYFPEVETITCYASIQNIKNKSLEELKDLRALGYNQFHIGLESAYDPALEIMNKGFTSKEAYTQIEKLTQAGIEWDSHILMGIAGKGNGEEHIKQTVDLINKFKPFMVSVMPLGVTTGSDLEVLVKNGEFIECTELEKLEEEKLLLNSLEFEDAYFFGSHPYNIAPISGPLTNKKQYIDFINSRISEIDNEVLSKSIYRRSI